MGLKKKNREFWQSAKLTTWNSIAYYNRLTEIALSRFKWNNLPDTCDERFLELTLFSQGHSVFFYDDVLGYLALRASLGGRWSVYNIPFERYVYASNSYQKRVTADDSVIIYNNQLHTNSFLAVEQFADRLARLDRIIDVNVHAQKTPIMILCDETQQFTMKNLYMKYEEDAPVIFGNNQINPNSIQVLNTNAPYVADKLYELKTKIWNEALTYLGVSNVAVTKKERLVTDEVMRNQGGTIASRLSALEARQQACDQINKMFGLDVSVEFRDVDSVSAGMPITDDLLEERINVNE